MMIAIAAMSALEVFGPAAPASATSTNIVITAPSTGTSFTSGVTSASVAITGYAGIGAQLAESNVVADLQVSVAFGNTVGYSCAHAADCGATTGQASTNFSYTPVVTRNGPYSVTATVLGNECGLFGCTPRSSTAATNFSVGVRPAPPRNVNAHVNADNSVAVTWSPSPEPDVFGYQVQRSGPGGSKTVDPGTQGTSFTDSGTGMTGGQFSYVVTAFRPGADGTSTPSTVLSSSSAPVDANVPVPPQPTTTLGPVGQPGVVTTTTIPAPPRPPTVPDLSAFLNQAIKAGAVPAAPPKAVTHSSPPRLVVPSVGAAGPPDTYAPTLPYGIPAPSTVGGGTGTTAAPAGAGNSAPRVPLAARPASHHGRSLVFPVAGGLLLCGIGVVVGVVNRRRPSLKPLEATDGEPPREPHSESVMASPEWHRWARSGVTIAPASAAAKAATGAAATAPSAAGGASAAPRGVAAAETAAVAGAGAGMGLGMRSSLRAGARVPGPGLSSRASPGRAAAAAAAAVQPEPSPERRTAPAEPLLSPEPAVSSAASGPPSTENGPMAPTRPRPRPDVPAPAPSLEEAVDYFRLLRNSPPAAADPETPEQIEAGTLTG